MIGCTGSGWVDVCAGGSITGCTYRGGTALRNLYILVGSNGPSSSFLVWPQKNQNERNKKFSPCEIIFLCVLVAAAEHYHKQEPRTSSHFPICFIPVRSTAICLSRECHKSSSSSLLSRPFPFLPARGWKQHQGNQEATNPRRVSFAPTILVLFFFPINDKYRQNKRNAKVTGSRKYWQRQNQKQVVRSTWATVCFVGMGMRGLFRRRQLKRPRSTKITVYPTPAQLKAADENMSSYTRQRTRPSRRTVQQEIAAITAEETDSMTTLRRSIHQMRHQLSVDLREVEAEQELKEHKERLSKITTEEFLNCFRENGSECLCHAYL